MAALPTAINGQITDAVSPEEQVQSNILTTTYDKVFNWARRSAIWPMQFGLACCAIEMMAVLDPRHDMSRFGAEVFRASPRQSDLMIVAGTVTEKMAPIVRRLWDQMPEPKWAIAMGACATCGGRGQVRIQQGVFSIQQTCPRCHGQGTVISDPCNSCGGNGKVERNKTLSVKVPAGVDTGDRIRLNRSILHIAP